MELRVGAATIEFVRGDITDQEVDAIVNAANAHLAGGGGVDGAIHRAGGPTILEECRKIGGCPTGSAVATGAGNLRATWVIHAVGPVWHGGDHREHELLASAYGRCMEIARERGTRSIAFPSISTGAYGFPIHKAARIALSSVVAALSGPAVTVDRVRFVLFSLADLTVYESTAREICPDR